MAQRVGRGIALLFHDPGTRRGWGVSSTRRLHFTPGKDPVPILQEAGWEPGPVWTGGKSRPHRDSIPDRPARSQSAFKYHLGLNLLTTGRLAIITAVYLPTKLLSSEDCGAAEDLRRPQHRWQNIISRKAKKFRAMSKPLLTRSLCTPVVVNFKEFHMVHIQQIIYIIARNNLF